MKIGVYIGSFNPVHNAHEQIATSLIDNNIIDKVIFIPVGDNYKKDDLASEKDRYNMLSIIADNNPKLEVSDYEFGTLKYTYETLNYFKEKYKKDIIYLILGSDNYSYIDRWKNGDYIIDNYKIIVIHRSDFYNKENNNLIVPNLNITKMSSTMIRELIKKNNNDCKSYLNPEVYNYINKHNLYT